MSRKTKKEVVSEFRTGEILEAARAVFAGKGFYAATVDAIAAEAGLSKGTVYLYYSSKNDIYWAALKHGVRELHETLRKEMAAGGTVKEKVHRFIAVKIRYFDENRDFFKIYLSEFGNAFCHPARLQKEFRDLYRTQAGILKAALDAGVKCREIRAIPSEAVAYAITDLTRNVITHRLLDWSKRKIQDDIRFVFDLVWKGIAP